MTAIAKAFERAGHASPDERLAQISRAIVKVIPLRATPAFETETATQQHKDRLMQLARDALADVKLWDAAKEQLYRRVRSDPDLLWAMFAPYRAQAAQALLTVANKELRLLETAKAPKPQESSGGHGPADDRLQIAPRAPQPSSQQRDAQMRQAQAAVSNVVALTLLDTFKVNGQSIGDLRSEEAARWAGAQERDARFVRLLTANLPPNEPIRKFRTGDEAAKLYALAQEIADA